MTKVDIGYVHDNSDLTHSFHESLQALLWHHIAGNSKVELCNRLPMRYGTDGLPGARNRVVQGFLSRDSDWLFWLDCDMGFAANTLDALVRKADKKKRPIMGALCFAMKETGPDGYGGWITEPRPTIYDFVKSGDRYGFVSRSDYERDSVVECSGTGSACILIHRSVFEAIADKFGPCWYDKAPDGQGGVLAEDLSFCIRASSVDKPTHVNTAVKTTHLKQVWLSEKHWDLHQSQFKMAEVPEELKLR